VAKMRMLVRICAATAALLARVNGTACDSTGVT
jgi:hypothetical protein